MYTIYLIDNYCLIYIHVGTQYTSESDKIN